VNYVKGLKFAKVVGESEMGIELYEIVIALEMGYSQV
jgi:hypothetical protein